MLSLEDRASLAYPCLSNLITPPSFCAFLALGLRSPGSRQGRHATLVADFAQHHHHRRRFGDVLAVLGNGDKRLASVFLQYEHQRAPCSFFYSFRKAQAHHLQGLLDLFTMGEVLRDQLGGHSGYYHLRHSFSKNLIFATLPQFCGKRTANNNLFSKSFSINFYNCNLRFYQDLVLLSMK